MRGLERSSLGACPRVTSPAPDCPNCQTALLGRWCHHCGQRRLDAADRRMGAVLRELWEHWLAIDGKWLRSMGALLFQPGRLALEHAQGKRIRWLSPISVFLSANLLFFLAPLLNDFNLSLEDQITLQPWSQWAHSWVDQRLLERGVDFASYAQSYAGTADQVARLAVLLHVPVLALGLWALYHRFQPLLVEHLTLALHIIAGALIAYGLWPWLVIALEAVHQGTAQLMLSGLLPLLGVWTLASVRRALSLRWWQLLLGAPLILLALYVCHFFYRFMQFLIVQALVYPMTSSGTRARRALGAAPA